MVHYDNQINRNQCMGWFENYCREFVRMKFGADNVRYYYFGVMGWKQSTFHFDLKDGSQFEGRLTYAECNNGQGKLELFQWVYNKSRKDFDLVNYVEN